MSPAIETRDLTKLYGAIGAVRGLDWTIPEGEACALLGPNGSGKTTALHVALGLIPPTRGTSRVLGEDSGEISVATRRRVGFVADRPVLPGWMSVGGLLTFHASLYPSWDAARERELLGWFAIPRDRRVSSLSRGQHRKLMLLLALAQDPDLLVLDEPAEGLDVGSRREFLRLLADFLAREGKTLVISTHIVTDVERIASRVTILDRGKLIEDAQLEELQERIVRVRLPRELAARAEEVGEPANVLSREENGRVSLLTLKGFTPEKRLHLERLGEGMVDVLSLSLEEILLARVGHGRTTKGGP